ncbi:MAG TPA: preprotein translocase subunit SecG [Bacteroidales bacterium]|nr:preprotein translocase subunit SecG [Bacteroidales bacterium]
MFIVVSILMLIASVLMGLVVLVQNSKGGGLASNFSASNQIMGVRQTADFLEKATWTLAAAMLFFALVSAIVIPNHTVNSGAADTELRNKIEQTKPVDFQAPPPQDEE